MKPLVETLSPAAGFVYTVFRLIEDIFSDTYVFVWVLQQGLKAKQNVSGVLCAIMKKQLVGKKQL